MSTHDDNATDWRDLADQLTDEQVAYLERCERLQIPPGRANPQYRLTAARSMARSNIIQSLHADIELPADAVGEVNEWQRWHGTYSRLYTIWSHVENSLRVEVFGTQHADGQVERHIVTEWPDAGMSAAEARRGAAALLNAADVLDGLDAE